MSNLANNTVTMEEILALVQSLPEGGGASFPNGTEWTQSNITNGKAESFCCANGVWVAAGDILRYSNDGKTWLPCTATSLSSEGYFEEFAAVGYANGCWVATSSAESIWYSENGIEWTPADGTDGWYFNKLGFGNGIWIASADHEIFTSSDGKAWTLSYEFSNNVNSILYASNIFVVGLVRGTYYSQDGVNWTNAATLGTARANDLDYGSGLFVAATTTGLHYSVDGKTWTQSNITSTKATVRHANGKWVAGGNGGAVFSQDGKTWTQSNVTGVFNDIDHANGVWVAGSANLGLWYSFDGEVWTQSNITGNMRHIHNANGVWVAGSGGSAGMVYSVGWEPS